MDAEVAETCVVQAVLAHAKEDAIPLAQDAEGRVAPPAQQSALVVAVLEPYNHDGRAKMDVANIEHKTGHKVIFSSVAGSRRFGLAQEGSDTEYGVYVIPGKSENYSQTGAYVVEGETEGCFFDCIAELSTIEGASGIHMVTKYGAVVYAISERISTFFAQNADSLAMISPENTYRNVRSMAERYLQEGDPYFMSRAARDVGFLWRFYRTGNMDFVLEEPFLSLYWALHREGSTLSPEYVREALRWLWEKKTRKFFESQPTNYALFQELQNVLAPYIDVCICQDTEREEKKMNKTISYIDYTLALADGVMSEETRTNYVQSMEANERGMALFGGILLTMVNIVRSGDRSTEDGIATVQQEFVGCQLEKTLGSYDGYQDIVKAFIEGMDPGMEPFARCQEVIRLADQTGNVCVQAGVYYAVLKVLSGEFLALRDRAFTRNVVEFVKNADMSQPGVDEFRLCAEKALSDSTNT